MDKPNFWGLQALVFALVAAAFTTVHITQPVLPILPREFGVSASLASLSVSAVILGIALASQPLSRLNPDGAAGPVRIAVGKNGAL